MTVVVTEFGTFRYNHLLMGMCILGDILQAKVDDLLSDIEGVKTYIDDILFLRNEILSKHIEKLRIFFGRLRTAGLNINAPKCILRLKDIPYLCYVITREVIKPDQNKLQGVMYIWRPTTTTEAQSLIGMFQYYGYMRPRRSHILSSLTEAASFPKGIKYFGMKH